MRVEVDSVSAASPHRIGELVVRVQVPADLSPHMLVLLERAATSCPAHHTLQLGAKISVRVEAPAPVG
jgi:hypothetical protein